jgi:AcrR family transcriptional regulator
MHSARTSAAIAGTEAPAPMRTEQPPPKSQTRVRLEVDARRAQLLELGRELFTTRDYDDLSIDDIARAAGISKGLLYHYFPGKRIFYVESLREAAADLLRRTMPPRDLQPIERLRAGIDAYLTYVDHHRSLFAAITSRGILNDPEVTDIVDTTRRQFIERLFTEIADAPIERNALRGWIGFIEASVLDWLERTDVTQRELSDLFTTVFQAVFQTCVARPAPR